VSRYDVFRRRIAPIALILAIGLIARDSCDKQQRTHATVELALGPAAAAARAITVEVVAAGDTVATFHRVALPDLPLGPCRFPLSTTAEDGELRIDLELGASHRRLTRPFHAVEGSTIVVPVPDDATR
jgi:hypothetical protein